MPELTTTALAQAWMRDPGADGTVLSMCADAAEKLIARLCGRDDEINGAHWLSATRTERLDGNFSSDALLTFTPITGITSVTITVDASSGQTVTLTNLECDGIAVASLSASDPGLYGRLGWRAVCAQSTAAWFDWGFPAPSMLQWRPSPNYGGGKSRVVVVYTGGYATAPADLKLLSTMMTAAMYQSSFRDQYLRAQTLGDFSETYGADPAMTDVIGSIPSLIGTRLKYSA